MKLNSKKELTPVVFGETSVKLIYSHIAPNKPVFKSHWHDRLELLLVKTGYMELCCDDQNITVNADELAIISPTMLHSGKSGNMGYKCYVIMFEISTLYNGTISAKNYIHPIINGKIRFKNKTNNKEIVNLANQIVEMQLNCKDYHPLETVSCLYRLLALLLKHCVDSDTSSSQINEKFDEVINYINSNFTKNISSSSISQKFGFEESYFCRKFKKQTGVTISKYIMTSRLEHARNLLKNSTESIRHIAISCGFADLPYFTRSFKAMYGISPTNYRSKLMKQTNEEPY